MIIPFTKITDWNGYLKRIVGKEPVYHVKVNNTIQICQNAGYDTFVYPAIMNDSAQKLARAINCCKSIYNRTGGGCFYINEFGVIIVPIIGAAPKVIGRWTGNLKFDGGDKFSKPFSLDVTNMKIGADWKYPYLGMKYQLDVRGRIYRWTETASGGYKESPIEQDEELISNLRKIRSSGPMSFVVNNHGVVLAKANDKDRWIPQYAGKINYNKWFSDPTATKNYKPFNI